MNEHCRIPRTSPNNLLETNRGSVPPRNGAWRFRRFVVASGGRSAKRYQFEIRRALTVTEDRQPEKGFAHSSDSAEETLVIL
jgi:hypothetical protein